MIILKDWSLLIEMGAKRSVTFLFRGVGRGLGLLKTYPFLDTIHLLEDSLVLAATSWHPAKHAGRWAKADTCAILNISTAVTTPLEKELCLVPWFISVSKSKGNQTTNWLTSHGPWGIFARVEQCEYWGFSSGALPHTTWSPSTDTMISCGELGNTFAVWVRAGMNLGTWSWQGFC